MKYILRILSIFLIFLICIEGTAKSTYSFETCKAFYQLDAREQFEKFVQINESYITSEEYDKTNFVFVYAPGEDFKFDRPMPRALFMDQDWLWESEPGFMPLAEEIYRDRLITYNNRTHPITEIKYQHYVVVIDMSKYYLSSSFEELSQNIPVEKLFIEHQSESLDDLVVNDLQFYTTSYEGFIENIWKGVDFSIFEGEADKLVTTALVSKNFSPLALGGNAGENSNPKINIEVEIRQSGNATGADWEQYTAATPPNHIGAFETIAFYINSYINTYYNDLEPDDLGCNQFKLYLFNQPIRDYYGTKCSEIDATPKLEGLVKRSAEFLDYLTEVEEAANETGVTPDQIIALNLSVNTWMTTIDGLIAAFKTSSQSDYISWLGDSWESLSGEEKEDFVNRAYYNSMIDITFNSFVDLKSEYYTSIGFLSPMSNSSAVNFFKRISGFTTHENLMYGGSRSLFVESLWSGFSDVLDALNTNSYSQSEKEEVFDLMKGNEDVIWHKILKFNSLGVPGWGVSGEQLVEKLRTFATETQQQSTSGPNGSSKYNIVQNDYNTVIWELYSKKYKYFDYDGLVLDTEYEIETNGIEERKTTIVDLADGKVGFNFSIKICPEYTNITTDLSNGNSTSSQTCNYQLIDLSTEAPVSMFDLVYFVKLKSPMYAEYCFDDSGQAGLCNNTVAVSPAFYNHTIEHYADVEEAIFNTLVVVQSFGALGVASRFLQAATATQFAIANLFVLNEAVGFYTLIDPAGFHNNMVTLVGEDNAVAMEFAVIAVNAVISFYATKDVPTLSLPNKTLKFEEAVELGVLQQLAKDAKLAGIEVDFGVDGEKIIASIVEDAKLHNTAYNSIRNSKLLDRYGVSNPKILEPAFEATRVNILKLRAQGKNIAPILNGFDDAKLAAWNTNVNNVAFREFFESSVSESLLYSRVDTWGIAYGVNSIFQVNPIAISLLTDLNISGFSALNLSILASTNELGLLTFANKLNLRSVSQLDVMSNHSKMVSIKSNISSTNYAILESEINTLLVKETDGVFGLQNVDGLTGGTNQIHGIYAALNSGESYSAIGLDLNISWANRLVSEGKIISLDALNKPDVLDDLNMAAYQCKKIKDNGSIPVKIKKAVNQLNGTAEPVPNGYSKNVVIQLYSTTHNYYNAEAEVLVNYIKNYNSSNNGILNGLEKIYITKVGTNSDEIIEILGVNINI